MAFQYLISHMHQAYLRDNGFLEFNQVPLLRIDGMNIVQTQAIVRYLARKHGLYGKNAKEDALYAIVLLLHGYLC